MMRQVIEHQRANRYADFAGAVIRGRVPIREAVVNDLLRTSLSHSSVIRDLHVVLHDNQRVEVALTLRKWGFRKHMLLDLEIEPQIMLGHSPTLRLWLPPSHQFLRSLVHLLTTLGAWLPRGVRVSGRLLEIDLGEIFHHQKLPELADWIRFMAIEGHRGVLLLFVELAVEVAQPHGYPR